MEHVIRETELWLEKRNQNNFVNLSIAIIKLYVLVRQKSTRAQVKEIF